jgi:hypothetical protein
MDASRRCPRLLAADGHEKASGFTESERAGRELEIAVRHVSASPRSSFIPDGFQPMWQPLSPFIPGFLFFTMLRFISLRNFQ